jgi:hypothetical protein
LSLQAVWYRLQSAGATRAVAMDGRLRTIVWADAVMREGRTPRGDGDSSATGKATYVVSFIVNWGRDQASGLLAHQPEAASYLA